MILFLLGACGFKTTIYTYESNKEVGIHSTFKFTVENEKALKQEPNNVLDLKKILESQNRISAASTPELLEQAYASMESTIQAIIKNNPKVDGYSNTVERKGNIINEKVSVDYEKAKISDLQTIAGFSSSKSSGK